MVNKVTTGEMGKTEQLLTTNKLNCLELQNKNYLLTRHFQSYWQFLSNHSGGNTKQTFWDCSCCETKLENSAQKLMYRVKNSQAMNMDTCPYNKLKDFYHRFKASSSFSACVEGDQHCNLMEISHNVMRDKFVFVDSSETRTAEDSEVPSFVKFTDEMCEDDKLDLPMSDCIYNADGQLVRMFICFGVEHGSDTSSVLSSSDSGCNDWESDCEDFIIFDSSCTDENNCCSRFDFVCETSELRKETFTKSVLLSPNLYCEVSVMESVDNKLDSLVQEMLQPNLCYRYEELILQRKSCKETETKSNGDFLSRSSPGKTVSRDKKEKKKKKKVCFKPDDELVTVHPMVVWSFAYKQARKGTWQVEALDRIRFQKRIKELDVILTPVLLAKMGKAV